MIDTFGACIPLNIETNVSNQVFYDWRKIRSNEGGILYFNRVGGINFWFHNLSKFFGLSFSAPKIIYGTNVRLIYEKDFSKVEKEVFKILKDSLSKDIMDMLPANLGEWEANKIDYCNNHYVKDANDKKYYIQPIAKTELARYNKTVYPTSVFFNNQIAKFVIYDKSAEMEARGEKPSKSETRIIRTEVGFRRKKIKSTFKKGTKVKDVFKDCVARSVLEGYYYKLFINSLFVTQAELHKAISEAFNGNWANKLIEFVEVINTKGVKKAKEAYKRTYHNNLLKLRPIDKNLIYLDDKVKEPISFKILFLIDFFKKMKRELETKKRAFMAFLILLCNKGLNLICITNVEKSSYYYEEGG